MKFRFPALIFESVRQKLPALLLEISCIVIAVTLSFYLDELRERNHEKEQLKGLIGSLITDIDEFNRYFNDSRLLCGRIIDTVDYCLQNPIEREIPDAAAFVLMNALSIDESFGSNTSSAFSGLLTSSVWQEIPDSIRRPVFDLYETDYGFAKTAIERTSNYSTHIKERYFPMLGSEIITAKGKYLEIDSSMTRKDYLPLKKGLRNAEFRAAIATYRNNVNKSLNAYSAAIESGKRNKVLLQAYLEKL